MLLAISQRVGKPIEPFRSVAGHGDEQRANVVGILPALLTRELGRHRAQRVPEGSTSGRIETAVVTVELLPVPVSSDSGAESVPVVRTYNYPLRQCKDHASGQTLPLDDVLSGAAG
jgi:protein subunit release factor A